MKMVKKENCCTYNNSLIPSLARRSAAKLETNRAITYDFEMKDKLVHKYHTCMDIATCIYSYMHAID